jgi:hypothetical protein
VQRLTLLATLRYGSANLLLVLGAAAFVIGGWAIWGVLAFALVFGSFADEVSGDDDMSLKESRCLFCTVNLYLTLPACRPAGLSAGALRRAAAEPHRAAVRNDRRSVADRLSLCPCRGDRRA